MKNLLDRFSSMRSGVPVLLGILLAATAAGAVDGNTRIRLATLAPKDSSFHKSLMTMGEKWRTATGGSLTLTIYTDGSQGGEADMVRRMRAGQLQAALLSGPGLSQIDPSRRQRSSTGW